MWNSILVLHENLPTLWSSALTLIEYRGVDTTVSAPLLFATIIGMVRRLSYVLVELVRSG